MGSEMCIRDRRHTDDTLNEFVVCENGIAVKTQFYVFTADGFIGFILAPISTNIRRLLKNIYVPTFPDTLFTFSNVWLDFLIAAELETIFDRFRKHDY